MGEDMDELMAAYEKVPMLAARPTPHQRGVLVSSIHGPLQTVDLQLLILSQRVVDSNFSLYVITHHATYLTSLSDSLWTSSTKLTKCLTNGQFFLLMPSL